jgi:hypothetical protein
MSPLTLDDVDVFYGELTVARALVYARLPWPADDAGLSVSGAVRGPRCLHAQTLPTSVPLVDQGAGPTMLARALVPDPVFWSPDLPAIYDVTVNLVRGGRTIATTRREIGLRALGVRGRKLLLAGKNWVLRGVSTHSTTQQLPRAWHEVSAAYCRPTFHVGQALPQIVASPVDPAHTECGPTLDEASQWGALVVAAIEEGGLRDLARYPAVSIAVLHGKRSPRFTPPQSFSNILLAQAVPLTGDFQPQPWAQLLLAPADNPQRIAELAASVQLPVLAIRRLASPLPIDEARAACDALQRDLAPIGQFAGYIV